MKSIILLVSILGAAAFGNSANIASIGEPLAIELPASAEKTFSSRQSRQSNYCLEEHNRVRSENGLPRFTADSRLEAAAADHNNVMVSQNCFSHQCEGEPSFSERISRRGYQWSSAAENIAKGYGDCGAAVRGWMNSDGHRRNILGNYRNIGCAERDRYYTCKFANPR